MDLPLAPRNCDFANKLSHRRVWQEVREVGCRDEAEGGMSIEPPHLLSGVVDVGEAGQVRKRRTFHLVVFHIFFF